MTNRVSAVPVDPAATTMRAAVVTGAGHQATVEVINVPRPRPRRGELLIKVAAAGVNRADLMQRRGEHPPPPGATNILGLECSGVVVGVGRDVPSEHIGRRVCALLAGGGYAEYVAVPLGMVMPMPAGVSFEAAAALPEAAATAHSNLFLQGRLRAGERALIHAGTSTVGTLAIQMAKAEGAEVVATARTSKGVEHCLRHGATAAQLLDGDPDRGDWWSAPGFDLVLDVLGGPYLQRNVAALRRRGRLVQVGLLAGRHGEIDLEQLLRRDLTILGSGLRARPQEEKENILRELRVRFWPLVETGAMRLPLDSIHALECVETAHDRVEGGGTSGKVVLRITSQPVNLETEGTSP